MASIVGYAAIYNQRSNDIGFFERISPGAFDGVLRRKQDCVCVLNHDVDQLLGRTASGTVRLSSDSTGLRYECGLPDTTLGKDVRELVSRGDLKASSFSFVCAADDWNISTDGVIERTVVQVADLYDVSPVTWPAYEATSVKLSRSNPLNPEQESTRQYMQGKLDELAAEDRKRQYSEIERRRMQLEMYMVKAGVSPEKARTMTGHTPSTGTTKAGTAKRTFRIAGKVVTRAQFLEHAKAKGVEGIEKRLSRFGKAERHTTRHEASAQ